MCCNNIIVQSLLCHVIAVDSPDDIILHGASQCGFTACRVLTMSWHMVCGFVGGVETDTMGSDGLVNYTIQWVEVNGLRQRHDEGTSR